MTDITQILVEEINHNDEIMRNFFNDVSAVSFVYGLNKRNIPSEKVGEPNTNLGIQYGFHTTKDFANTPGVQNLLNPIKNFEMANATDNTYPHSFNMEQIIPLLFTKIKEIEERLDIAGIAK
tara:strand:- start:2888 stop:3253 length:366 start_codon:yes stop_codon:yes gene_type:complete